MVSFPMTSSDRSQSRHSSKSNNAKMIQNTAILTMVDHSIVISRRAYSASQVTTAKWVRRPSPQWQTNSKFLVYDPVSFSVTLNDCNADFRPQGHTNISETVQVQGRTQSQWNTNRNIYTPTHHKEITSALFEYLNSVHRRL